MFDVGVDVVGLQIKLFGIFWPLKKQIGSKFNHFFGHAVQDKRGIFYPCHISATSQLPKDVLFASDNFFLYLLQVSSFLELRSVSLKYSIRERES